MPKTNLPVIAAIPNYNMAKSLGELLPQLIKQNYSAVYVLDDVSTDNSREVVKSFGKQVVWVGGTENLGSGGNRNRILGAHPANCIIHFLDADVRLLSTDVVANARQMMRDPNTGFVGGLVIENGHQSIWNFGPRHAVGLSLSAILQQLCGTKQGTHTLWQRSFRWLIRHQLDDYPDLTAKPVRKAVFWIPEANMLITRARLVELGGFDPTIREHDIMTLAYSAYPKGFTNYFDPAISVEHHSIQVRNYNREWVRIKTARYLRRKFNVSIWT